MQNLVWSYGFSPVVPVLNLSTPKRKQVLFTSSHVGIIYDFRYNKQRILEGHVSYLLTNTEIDFSLDTDFRFHSPFLSNLSNITYEIGNNLFLQINYFLFIEQSDSL